MSFKKVVYALGWILIGIGILGLVGVGAYSIQIPCGAQKINDYAYVMEIENGQQRLVISSKPLQYFWLFDILSPRADNRATVMNIYPDTFSPSCIYAGDGTTKYRGFAEYFLYNYNIQSITSARLYFGGQLNKQNTTTKVNIYACSNIPENLNWNYTPPLGALQGYVNVTAVSPDWQSFQLDVTNAAIAELNNDGIATFAFICPAGEGAEGGEACFGRESDPAPTLEIDYVPGSGGGGSGGSEGSGGGDSGSSSSSSSSTSTTGTTIQTEDSPTVQGIPTWPILLIVIGFVLVLYGGNGKVF